LKDFVVSAIIAILFLNSLFICFEKNKCLEVMRNGEEYLLSFDARIFNSVFFAFMMATITEERLRLQDAVGAVSHSRAGALVTFEGVVRDHSRDLSGQTREVDYLEYEAYRPMAEREMARVVCEAQKRWDVVCAASHRVGKLQIGETAVVIAVSSSHRDDAFQACRFAIDRIKETVPIWKKEVARDGFWWVENPVEQSAKSTVETSALNVRALNVTSTPAVEQQSAN